MKIRVGLLALVCVSSAAAVVACFSGNPDETSSRGSSAVTPAPAATIVHLVISDLVQTAPATGEVDDGGPGTVAFTGYASRANLPIAIQTQSLTAAAGDPWVTVATTTTSNVAQDLGNPLELAYAWNTTLPASQIPNGLDAGWSGGLVRVRAISNYGLTAQDTTFDEDNGACFAQAVDGGAAWITAASGCATVFGEPTVIASSAILPGQPDSITNPLPSYLTMPQPGVTSGGVFSPVHSATETANYYAATGATVNTPTLAQFQSYYGFGPTQASAIYYNYGDLGLARDMHCQSWTRARLLFGEACYVRNFELQVGNNINAEPRGPDKVTPDVAHHTVFGFDPAAAIAATIASANAGEDAGTPADLIATVAMVSSSNRLYPLDPPTITFVAYDFNGNLLYNAVLDDVAANTAIPQNCLTCHGGSTSYDTVAHAVVGTPSFLAFDPVSLLFAASPPQYTATAQAEAIRQLNTHVMASHAATGVQSIITNLYSTSGGVYTPGATADDTVVPSGWATTPASSKVYTEVVHPYCATCHSTSASDPLLTFATATTNATAIQNDVCGGTHVPHQHGMPQAEQTMLHFWGSGARAYLADGLAGWSSDCTP